MKVGDRFISGPGGPDCVVEVVYEATNSIIYLRDAATGEEWSTHASYFREHYRPYDSTTATTTDDATL